MLKDLTLTPGGYAAEKQIPISLTLTPGGYAAEKQIPISISPPPGRDRGKTEMKLA